MICRLAQTIKFTCSFQRRDSVMRYIQNSELHSRIGQAPMTPGWNVTPSNYRSKVSPTGFGVTNFIFQMNKTETENEMGTELYAWFRLSHKYYTLLLIHQPLVTVNCPKQMRPDKKLPKKPIDYDCRLIQSIPFIVVTTNTVLFEDSTQIVRSRFIPN